jgi:adenine-specific DNA-methyltransferase
MNGESLNIQQCQLEKLKQLFPETITEGKVDWEKLQATLGKENIEFQNERYVLNWAGKTDAFKVLQQSTTATLKPVQEESINFNTTENVFIEGENLEVLKVLQKSYYGKIKCIIIDPPYNTGSDSFIYPDSFKESRADYEKRIGEKDEDGYLMKEGFFRKNSRDSGHYHSNWLSMMYPRLFLARNLLTDDGVIFIHIDDNEVHNLRMIMNEIFGEENFITSIIWEKRFTRSNNSKQFASLTEYILLYRKTDMADGFKEGRTEKADSIYSNIDNDTRGLWTSVSYVNPATKEQRPNLSYKIRNPFNGREIEHPTNAWKYEKTVHLRHVEENRLYWGQFGNNTYPRLKKFLNELAGSMVPSNLWKHEETGTTDQGSKILEDLFSKKIFDFPKPPSVIKKALGVKVNDDSDKDFIVLDFFAGSGTTAQAVLELNKEDGGNRKFILVQLPELCDEQSEAFKAGYKTIADISKERIRRVIKKLQKEAEELQMKREGELQLEPANSQLPTDLGFKVFKLSSSNFKIWRGSEITGENLEQQLEIFTNPVREGSEKENMLYELMLKAGYPLHAPLSKWRRAGGEVFSINNGELIIALDEMTQELIEAVIKAYPKKVITLDNLFAGNDQLKTNSVLQMRDAEIDFKTI